jgi:hypothetical protein
VSITARTSKQQPGISPELPCRVFELAKVEELAATKAAAE